MQEIINKIHLGDSLELMKLLPSDPFMGSGTTANACIQLDRQFIGYEIDVKHELDMITERYNKTE